jgi:hypothetical protein
MVDGASSSASRTVYVADAKTGQLWKPAEWRKIIQGFTRQGYFPLLIPCAIETLPNVSFVAWWLTDKKKA